MQFLSEAHAATGPVDASEFLSLNCITKIQKLPDIRKFYYIKFEVQNNFFLGAWDIGSVALSHCRIKVFLYVHLGWSGNKI